MARGTRFRKGIKSTTNGGQVGGSVAYSGSSVTITHGWDTLTSIGTALLTSSVSLGIIRIADNSINGAVSAAIYGLAEGSGTTVSYSGSTATLLSDSATIYWVATGY